MRTYPKMWLAVAVLLLVLGLALTGCRKDDGAAAAEVATATCRRRPGWTARHSRPQGLGRWSSRSRRWATAAASTRLATPELGQDVGHVHAGRLGADEQGVADLAVTAALGHQGQHLELAGGQAELGPGRRLGRRGRPVPVRGRPVRPGGGGGVRAQVDSAEPGQPFHLAAQGPGPQGHGHLVGPAKQVGGLGAVAPAGQQGPGGPPAGPRPAGRGGRRPPRRSPRASQLSGLSRPWARAHSASQVASRARFQATSSRPGLPPASAAARPRPAGRRPRSRGRDGRRPGRPGRPRPTAPGQQHAGSEIGQRPLEGGQAAGHGRGRLLPAGPARRPPRPRRRTAPARTGRR
jgi:hypothetical protein